MRAHVARYNDRFCVGVLVFNITVLQGCLYGCNHGYCLNGQCVCDPGWAVDSSIVNKSCTMCATG